MKVGLVLEILAKKVLIVTSLWNFFISRKLIEFWDENAKLATFLKVTPFLFKIDPFF